MDAQWLIDICARERWVWGGVLSSEENLSMLETQEEAGCEVRTIDYMLYSPYC